MTQPNIAILFTELAATAIARGERGIIALILKGTKDTGAFCFGKATEVPADFEEGNACRKRIIPTPKQSFLTGIIQ